MTAPARRFFNPWRVTAWGGAALAILAPLVAMRFSTEVAWTGSDFAFAVALVGVVGVAFELAVRVSDSLAYRIGAGVALAAGLLLIWANLAVGVIGSENNPANQIFFAVPAVAAIGVVVARFRPRGMMGAKLAAAVTQVAVAVIAFLAGWGFVGPITVVFASLWLIAAGLFRKAADTKA